MNEYTSINFWKSICAKSESILESDLRLRFPTENIDLACFLQLFNQCQKVINLVTELCQDVSDCENMWYQDKEYYDNTFRPDVIETAKWFLISLYLDCFVLGKDLLFSSYCETNIIPTIVPDGNDIDISWTSVNPTNITEQIGFEISIAGSDYLSPLSGVYGCKYINNNSTKLELKLDFDEKQKNDELIQWFLA